MSAINLSPEAVELVNQLCDPDNLADKITVLDADLYDIAYTLKRYKQEYAKLKMLMEDGGEE